MSRSSLRGPQLSLILSGFLLLIAAGFLFVVDGSVHLDLYCHEGDCAGGWIEFSGTLQWAIVSAGLGFALLLASISVGVAALSAAPVRDE